MINAIGIIKTYEILRPHGFDVSSLLKLDDNSQFGLQEGNADQSIDDKVLVGDTIRQFTFLKNLLHQPQKENLGLEVGTSGNPIRVSNLEDLTRSQYGKGSRVDFNDRQYVDVCAEQPKGKKLFDLTLKEILELKTTITQLYRVGVFDRAAGEKVKELLQFMDTVKSMGNESNSTSQLDGADPKQVSRRKLVKTSPQ